MEFVVLVELLLLRVEIANSDVLLGDGGGLCRFLGAAAFGQVAGLGLMVRIALGVLKSDGLLPASLGGRLLPFERKRKGFLLRGFFRGDWPCGFFLGDPPATSASAMPPSILAP